MDKAFCQIFNLQSEFYVEELMKVRERMIRMDMVEPHSVVLESDLGMFKIGIDGRESGILPEMLKAACEVKEVVELLLEVAKDLWRDSKVPSDWYDAVFVTITKNRDLEGATIGWG